MLLSQGKPGQILIVEKLDSPEAAGKLMGLGVSPGAKIKILAFYPFGGPLTLKTGKTVIGLGRGLAKKIYLKPGVSPGRLT